MLTNHHDHLFAPPLNNEFPSSKPLLLWKELAKFMYPYYYVRFNSITTKFPLKTLISSKFEKKIRFLMWLLNWYTITTRELLTCWSFQCTNNKYLWNGKCLEKSVIYYNHRAFKKSYRFHPRKFLFIFLRI